MPDLAAIFRCHDQSALLSNYVANEDPGLGAWSHHSDPASPLGRVSFPEVLAITSGLVYTARPGGRLVEHHLTRHEWLPWRYSGQGRDIAVERTAFDNVWIGRIRLKRGGKGLLVLEIAPLWKERLTFERTATGLAFSWTKGSRIELGFSAGEIALSGDANPLRRRFAGFDDVRITDAQAQWEWQHGNRLAVGVTFDDELEVSFAIDREPVSFEAAEAAERKRWEQFFADSVPPLKTRDRVRRDTWHFAWQVLWANHLDAGRGVLRSGFTSPARLHYGSQWWWDSAFHALVLSHLRGARAACAYGELDNFIREQQADGQILGSMRFAQDAVQERIGASSHPLQPPVIGAILPHLRRRVGAPPYLEPLRRYAEWLASPANDIDGDGLAEYRNSFETGLDQSPLWDGRFEQAGAIVGPMRPVAAVELNVWLSMLWDEVGESGRARELFARLDEACWDEADGFYYHLDPATRQPIRVKTPIGFMPMLSPYCRRDRAERLVREHLLNPAEFWGCPYPLPSVSLDHPAFTRDGMWRGPTWINVNWLVVQALRRQGFEREARELSEKTIRLVGPRYEGRRRVRSPRLWEWYDPISGEALGNVQYSWSTLVIDLIADGM